MANTSEMMRDEEKRADRDDMRLKNTQRMTQGRKVLPSK